MRQQVHACSRGVSLTTDCARPEIGNVRDQSRPHDDPETCACTAQGHEDRCGFVFLACARRCDQCCRIETWKNVTNALANAARAIDLQEE